jgi:hypothetical protein
MPTVRRMHERDEDRCTIWNYIRDVADVDIEMKDPHNPAQKMGRENYTAPTSEGRVRKYLSDFTSEEGNTARVNTDDEVGGGHDMVPIYSTSNNTVYGKGYGRSLVLQSAHQRQSYIQSPEVVLIDATHGTNKDNYKLFSLMVHDAFGHGQHVQVLAVDHYLVDTGRIGSVLTIALVNVACSSRK